MVTVISVEVVPAFFLVITNGIFVAAEFAFVKIRPTQVNTLVGEGKPGARLVQEAVRNLDNYLAIALSASAGSASPPWHRSGWSILRISHAVPDAD